VNLERKKGSFCRDTIAQEGDHFFERLTFHVNLRIDLTDEIPRGIGLANAKF